MVTYVKITSGKEEDGIKYFVKDEQFFLVSAACAGLEVLRKLDKDKIIGRDIKKPGVYILFNNESVYVGQASTSIYERLNNHDYKDWFKYIIWFGKKDKELEKSQLDFLEGEMIEFFKRSEIYKVKNVTKGNNSAIKDDNLLEAEKILDYVIEVLNNYIKIDIGKENMATITPKPSCEEFMIKLDGNEILGKNKKDKFFNLFKKLLKIPEYRKKVEDFCIEGKANSTNFVGTEPSFIPSSGKPYTEKLEDKFYLYNNFSVKDLIRKIKFFADKTGLDITVL